MKKIGKIGKLKFWSGSTPSLLPSALLVDLRLRQLEDLEPPMQL